jgi:hypothetical protein
VKNEPFDDFYRCGVFNPENEGYAWIERYGAVERYKLAEYYKMDNRPSDFRALLLLFGRTQPG